MQKQLSFQTDKSSDVVQHLIIEYMENIGYRVVQRGWPLVFERGSILGSFLSLSPKGWRSKVTISVQENAQGATVIVQYDINTKGQMVTSEEQKFWLVEQNGLENKVQYLLDTSEGSQTAEKSSLILNVAIMLALIIIVVVLAIIFRLL